MDERSEGLRSVWCQERVALPAANEITAHDGLAPAREDLVRLNVCVEGDCRLVLTVRRLFQGVTRGLVGPRVEHVLATALGPQRGPRASWRAR